MRLNTKMRYGTRALLDLALRSGGAAVSLSEIAAAQQISDKYLEQLFAADAAAREAVASAVRRRQAAAELLARREAEAEA